MKYNCLQTRRSNAKIADTEIKTEMSAKSVKTQ